MRSSRLLLSGMLKIPIIILENNALKYDIHFHLLKMTGTDGNEASKVLLSEAIY